jgi:hypothetical protein
MSTATAARPAPAASRRCLTLADTREAARRDAAECTERMSGAAIERCVAILAPHLYPSPPE